MIAFNTNCGIMTRMPFTIVHKNLLGEKEVMLCE